MADIQRLTRLTLYFVLGLVLGAISVVSHAETISATLSVTSYTIGSYSAKIGGYPTQQEACEAGLGWLKSGGGVPAATLASCTARSGITVSGPGQIVGDADYAYPPNGHIYQYVTSFAVGYTCPSGQNWTLQGNQCTRAECVAPQTRQSDGTCACPAGKVFEEGQCLTLCPAGYHRMKPDNGTCEKDCIGDQTQDSTGKCTCAIGNNKEWISFSGSYDSTTGCANGCQYNLGGMAIGNAVTKTYYTRGQRNGSICGANTNLTPAPKLVDKTPLPPADTSGTSKDGATPDPKNTPKNAGDPEACAAAGGSYGTYNGAAKCLTPDANTPQITTKREESATTNPDGSKSATKGSTTTTCNGTSCTTTSESSTTTTDAAGNSKTTTTTGSGSGSGTGSGSGQKDFCADHPNSIICKNSSWSGDCAIPPVCDGDAVACATAKAVWEHRCVNKWAESANPLSDAVDQQNLFGDQAKADAALNKDGSKDFDILAKFQEKRRNYLTFASSCSPDLSFDFKGQHYQFDTTILCQFGLVIKILLHLTAYMTLIRVFTTKLF